MAEHPLLTAGYAGHTPASLLQKLRDAGVEMVIDVRQNPVSRKRGFSRAQLSEFLERHAVNYIHMKELGVPTMLRHSLRDGDCELSEYLRLFRQYLAGQVAATSQVYRLAISRRCCLMCVEEKPEVCHRSVVAEVVVGTNGQRLEILHL